MNAIQINNGKRLWGQDWSCTWFVADRSLTRKCTRKGSLTGGRSLARDTSETRKHATCRHFSTDWRSVSELAISRQLRAKSAKRPCGAPCVGIRRTWSGKSETVQSEDRDVVDLAESSRLFGDALRCLGADFTSTFETEKLASCALGFNHAVGEQREAVTGV